MYLKHYLKQNLKPKEFVEGGHNCYFYYSEKEKWKYKFENLHNSIGTIYFDNFDISATYVVAVLNVYNITPLQLKEVFRELGWL